MVLISLFLEILLILIPIFFTISVIYSAAGFGGGSSYLAILALFPLEFTEVRMLALLCNIVVVSGSVYVFYKHGFLNFRKVLPLILLSVPFAYLGGRLEINQEIFFIVLGITLLIAGILMLVNNTEKTVKLPLYTNGIIGGGIGFLSGLVGIGGGIFLSPLLYLSRWAEAKVIATTTACFILVNSISGLIGQISANGFNLDFKLTTLLLITVLIGGQIGSRLTATKINPKIVRQITAFLILFVALKILFY
ncbi:MAG: sulfite exporter TauE/SafE family protein [Saprospiraceae bacterium]|nr:sulfite exporter TauE/SafE family protein [Saprospiraceae bacterium]